MNNLQKEADKLNKRLKPLYDEVALEINKGATVGEAFAKTDYYNRVTEDVLNTTTNAASFGTIGTSYALEMQKHRDWYLNTKHLGGALSDNIRSSSANAALTKQLKKGLKFSNSVNALADSIKSDSVTKLPKQLRALTSTARIAGVDANTAKLVKDARAYVNGLSGGPARGSKQLKTAYTQLINSAASGNLQEKYVEKATQRQLRYVNERIARTEMANSYEMSRRRAYDEDEGITGYRIVLSDEHPVTDECFVGSTKVQMADGSKKRICNVTVGDVVLTGSGGRKTVTATNKSKSKSVIRVATHKSYVYTTRNHPFLIGKEWIDAGDLRKGYLSTVYHENTFSQWRLSFCGGAHKGIQGSLQNVVSLLQNLYVELCDVVATYREIHKRRIFSLSPYRQTSEEHGYCIANEGFYHLSNLGFCFQSLRESFSSSARLLLSTFRHGFSQTLGYFHHLHRKIESKTSVLGCLAYTFYRNTHTANLSHGESLSNNHDCKSNVNSSSVCSCQQKFLCRTKNTVLELFSLPFILLVSMLSLLKYTLLGRATVYNLTVEDEHTYIANGFVVHNCDHYADADLYGQGAGVYPNSSGITVPIHTMCLCTTMPVRFDMKNARYSEKRSQEYVKGLSDKDRKRVIGAKTPLSDTGKVLKKKGQDPNKKRVMMPADLLTTKGRTV